MSNLKKVELSQTGDVGRLLQRIKHEWMLITAGSTEKCNTMTASWGGIGVLWGQNMVNIFVRPERYTYEFVEGSDYFSVAFFPPEYKKALALCGAESGRDMDKIEACGFTVEAGVTGGVYFAEADLVLICKKRYRAPLEFERMIDVDPSLYYGPQHGGLHVMYMGEIVEIYTKED